MRFMLKADPPLKKVCGCVIVLVLCPWGIYNKSHATCCLMGMFELNLYDCDVVVC